MDALLALAEAAEAAYAPSTQEPSAQAGGGAHGSRVSGRQQQQQHQQQPGSSAGRSSGPSLPPSYLALSQPQMQQHGRGGMPPASSGAPMMAHAAGGSAASGRLGGGNPYGAPSRGASRLSDSTQYQQHQYLAAGAMRPPGSVPARAYASSQALMRPQEELIFAFLHSRLGNNWELISQHVPSQAPASLEARWAYICETGRGCEQLLSDYAYNVRQGKPPAAAFSASVQRLQPATQSWLLNGAASRPEADMVAAALTAATASTAQTAGMTPPAAAAAPAARAQLPPALQEALSQLQERLGGGAAQQTQAQAQHAAQASMIAAAMARYNAAASLAATNAAARLQQQQSSSSSSARIASAKYAAEAYHAQKSHNFEESAKMTELWRLEQQQAQQVQQQQHLLLDKALQRSRLQGSSSGPFQQQQQAPSPPHQQGLVAPYQAPRQLAGMQQPASESQRDQQVVTGAGTGSPGAAAQQLQGHGNLLASLTAMVKQGMHPAAASHMLQKVLEYYTAQQQAPAAAAAADDDAPGQPGSTSAAATSADPQTVPLTSNHGGSASPSPAAPTAAPSTAEPAAPHQQQQPENQAEKQQQQACTGADAQSLLQDINGLEAALQKLHGAERALSGRQQQASHGQQPQGQQQQQAATSSPARGVSPQASAEAAAKPQEPSAAQLDERSSSQTPEPHDVALVTSTKQRLLQMPNRPQVLRQVFEKLYVDIHALTASQEAAAEARGGAGAGTPAAAPAPMLSPEPGSSSPATSGQSSAVAAFRAAAERNKHALMWEATAAVLDNSEPRVRMARSQFGGTRRVTALADLQATPAGRQTVEALQKLLLVPYDLPPGAHIVCEVALPSRRGQAQPAAALAGAGAGAAAAAAPDSTTTPEAAVSGDEPPQQQQQQAEDKAAASRAGGAESLIAAPVVVAATGSKAGQQAPGVVVVHAHAGFDAALLPDEVAAFSTGSKRGREELHTAAQQQPASPLASKAASLEEQPAPKRPYREGLFL